MSMDRYQQFRSLLGRIISEQSLRAYGLQEIDSSTGAELHRYYDHEQGLGLLVQPDSNTVIATFCDLRIADPWIDFRWNLTPADSRIAAQRKMGNKPNRSRIVCDQDGDTYWQDLFHTGENHLVILSFATVSDRLVAIAEKTTSTSSQEHGRGSGKRPDFDGIRTRIVHRYASCHSYYDCGVLNKRCLLLEDRYLEQIALFRTLFKRPQLLLEWTEYFDSNNVPERLKTNVFCWEGNSGYVSIAGERKDFVQFEKAIDAVAQEARTNIDVVPKLLLPQKGLDAKANPLDKAYLVAVEHAKFFVLDVTGEPFGISNRVIVERDLMTVRRVSTEFKLNQQQANRLVTDFLSRYGNIHQMEVHIIQEIRQRQQDQSGAHITCQADYNEVRFDVDIAQGAFESGALEYSMTSWHLRSCSAIPKYYRLW